MSETLPLHRNRHYQRHPARWAERASFYIGTAPATIEASVHGTEAIHERVGHILRSLIATGDLVTHAKVMAPIQAANLSLTSEELNPDLITRAQAADVEEEICETRYLADPTPHHRRRWRLAIEAQQAMMLRLHRAIVREEAK